MPTPALTLTHTLLLFRHPRAQVRRARSPWSARMIAAIKASAGEVDACASRVSRARAQLCQTHALASQLEVSISYAVLIYALVALACDQYQDDQYQDDMILKDCPDHACLADWHFR